MISHQNKSCPVGQLCDSAFLTNDRLVVYSLRSPYALHWYANRVRQVCQQLKKPVASE